MVDIAVGTKVFTRTNKLGNLLLSINETDIDRVYLADDGEMTAEKESLYSREFDFELRVIDLEYDAGLGKGRREIVDQLDDENYLLIVDTDHEIPVNVSILADQLDQDPSIGGIAGTLVEPGRGRIFQSAKDLHEEGKVLVASADTQEKTIESISDYPFIEFDYLPNAAMFRVEALEDYCWDPNYVIGKEHMDFYVGHWKQTDWRFGVCPGVLFNHYPGGDTTYVTNRHSIEKSTNAESYFFQKWGYVAVRRDRSYWFDTEPIFVDSVPRRILRVYRSHGLSGLIFKSLADGPRVLKNTLFR